jgi:serine/threonine protein kinase
MVGKQSYMPPEQLRGKAVPQSDIYSFGGTLYFLLTGRDPTPLEVSQVEEDSNLSLNLNPLLAKCTAVEVAGRYNSAVELLHDIRKIRDQRRVEAVSLPAHNPY